MTPRLLYDAYLWPAQLVRNRFYLMPHSNLARYNGQQLETVKTPKRFYVRPFNSDDGQTVRVDRGCRTSGYAKGPFVLGEIPLQAIYGLWFTPRTHPLFVRNFRFQPFDLQRDFQFFEVPGYVADDGQASQNERTGLTITSVPFTKRAPGILDHTKYLVLTQKSFMVPTEDMELFLEANVFWRATGLVQDGKLAPGIQKYAAGIQNIRDEPRLSAGALNFLDLDTGMVFDFILSDSTIYALYEHLPVTEDTRVFTFAKAVGSRATNLDTPVNLKIGYNGYRKLVTWYIDGNPVFQVVRPGLPLVDRSLYVLNGDLFPEREVEVQSLAAGFGNFTLLDFFPFDESYEEIGQSYTTNLEKVQPLADLGGAYFQRMTDQLGRDVPQTDFVYTGPPVQDGQGAVLNLLDLKVGLAHPLQEQVDCDQVFSYPYSILDCKWRIPLSN